MLYSILGPGFPVIIQVLGTASLLLTNSIKTHFLLEITMANPFIQSIKFWCYFSFFLQALFNCLGVLGCGVFLVGLCWFVSWNNTATRALDHTHQGHERHPGCQQGQSWRAQLVLTKRKECTTNRIFLISVLKDPISATKAVLVTLLKGICRIITLVQQRGQVTNNYLLPEKNPGTGHQPLWKHLKRKSVVPNTTVYLSVLARVSQPNGKS